MQNDTAALGDTLFEMLENASKARVAALRSLKYRVVDGRCPHCREPLMGDVVECEPGEIRNGEQGADRLYLKASECLGCLALLTVDGGTLYVGEPSGCAGCGSPLRLSEATQVVDPTEYYCAACHAEGCEGRRADCAERRMEAGERAAGSAEDR
jgi:hypothetical protein